MWDVVAQILMGPPRSADDNSYWAQLDRAVMAAFPGVDCRTHGDCLSFGAMTTRWFKAGTDFERVGRHKGIQIRAFVQGFRAGADAMQKGISE